MEAFPHMSTIEYFVENEADKYPQSHVLDFHNKADGHERRIATYLVENLRTATDLEACALAQPSGSVWLTQYRHIFTSHRLSKLKQ